ncbi:MAG: methyltransferase domain-containing protein, partial [Bacteroidota bacterium]
DINDSINRTRTEFNKALFNQDYTKIISDDTQLTMLIDMMEPGPNKSFLDLGTGNGYVAFELAKRYNSANVVGIDIAEKAVRNNRKIAKEEGLENLSFDVYDGVTFPYPGSIFDGIISRYAIHHFPDLNKTVNNIYKLLKDHGVLVISDPAPDNQDVEREIDKFMRLKNDGHIKLYTLDELKYIFENNNLIFDHVEYSGITFPREMNKHYQKWATGLSMILKKQYKLRIETDQIFLTLKVLNAVFKKNSRRSCG